jgi:hypothetical protein
MAELRGDRSDMLTDSEITIRPLSVQATHKNEIEPTDFPANQLPGINEAIQEANEVTEGQFAASLKTNDLEEGMVGSQGGEIEIGVRQTWVDVAVNLPNTRAMVICKEAQKGFLSDFKIFKRPSTTCLLLWETSSGKLLWHYRVTSSIPLVSTFSSLGRYLAFYDGDSLRALDTISLRVERLKLPETPLPQSIIDIAVQPSGARIAIACAASDSTTIYTKRLPLHDLVYVPFRGEEEPHLRYMEYSRDGAILSVTFPWKGQVKVVFINSAGAIISSVTYPASAFRVLGELAYRGTHCLLLRVTKFSAPKTKEYVSIKWRRLRTVYLDPEPYVEFVILSADGELRNFAFDRFSSALHPDSLFMSQGVIMRCDWISQRIRALELRSGSETVVAQFSYSSTLLQAAIKHAIRKITFSDGYLTLVMPPRFMIIPTSSPRNNDVH